ncbi:AEC family transporter [Fictibacillus terranigra]|uniref:AEC family transporter n=1 Tax=Fictibacillus terranigra TaxID=3058424 RepID=A0ABT8E5B5_9BACL|nr:AEC family transporter [Fictibacillus sp. CENA-BCM004]MDN4073085.1 AEC family transporter [Fictibacillus sp. CENA-BCM004]
MKIFLMIIVNVILPVFILIGIGAFIHRKYKLDLNTLSKINNYLLMPAVSFVNIYQSEIRGEALLTIIGFLLLQNGCLILLSSTVAKISRFDRSLSATFKNSVVLNNSGNFGLPVSQLVFQHNPLGASIQVIVTIFQNFITYTYGLMNSASVHTKRSTAIKSFLKNPIFFALLLGLAFQMTAIKLPSFLWTPIDNISSAFIAVALITLGAQSAYLRINQFSLPLLLSLIGRLIISPMIALALILSLKLDGTTAQALFIASSFPSSRNSALFALEHGNHPSYAAQTVLLSTLFSSLTVTLVVYLSKVLFY